MHKRNGKRKPNVFRPFGPPANQIAGLGFQGPVPSPEPGTDERQLRVQLQWKQGKVAMVFGDKVEWLGFTPEQAISLGKELQEFGRKARDGDKQ